jgi:hypothetical protein
VLIPWLSRCGEVRALGSLRVVTATIERFLILYRTPFSGPLPEFVAADYQEALMLHKRGRVNLAYGLDVWVEGKKAMNIEWDERTTIHLVSFRSGDWENDLLTLCSN